MGLGLYTQRQSVLRGKIDNAFNEITPFIQLLFVWHRTLGKFCHFIDLLSFILQYAELFVFSFVILAFRAKGFKLFQLNYET